MADIKQTQQTEWRATAKDWIEDFSGENGIYSCKCIHCGDLFTGHKRRVSCKACTLKALSARLTAMEEALKTGREAIRRTCREHDKGGHELSREPHLELLDALSKISAVLEGK